MSNGITFSGLGSGLDTDSIISQLVSIEKRPITLMQKQQKELEQKKEIVQSIDSSLLTLKDSVAALEKDDLFSVVQAHSSDADQVSVSASNEAAAGDFSVEVLGLAQARRLSSRSLGSLSEPLDLSGELVINGTGVEIEAEDTLLDVRDKINAAGADVSAQVLTVDSSDNRLILTAGRVGAQGFDLKDASSSDLLQALGFNSSETHIKKAFVDGARSAGFLAADQSIASLLNLNSPPSGTVSVGGEEISVDLATDTLQTLRDKINAAAPAGVSATVISSEEDGLTRYRLEVDGTTSFVDDNGILEALGVLSQGAVANEIVSGAESDAYTSTTTAVGSLLGLGSAPAGTVSIGGTDIALDLAADSLTAIQTRINDAAPAGVDAVVVSSTDGEGNTRFRLRIEGTTEFTDSNNVLEALGIVESSPNSFEAVARVLTGNVANQQQGTLLHPTDDGAKSSTFASELDPVQLLNGSTASGTLRIADQTVAVDLAVDSLSDIRDKINAAAPTGVSASINDLGGTYELQIDGTTDLGDDGGVLEALGVVSAPTAMTADTHFSDIVDAGVESGDTITITGTNHAGEQVAGTFTISSPSARVDGLLSAVEQTFGGEVTATVDSSGRIVVADNTPGASPLSVTLQVNNEGGGSLNLGTMTVTTQGTDARSSELQAGKDALLAVNGITLTRDTNTISDAIQGVTLDLKKAEPGKIIEISVTRDDTTALRERITSFVDDYNTAMKLINDQFVYHEKEKKSGPLSGDVTLMTLQSQLRSVLTAQIPGLPEDFNALVLVGLSFDKNGQLNIDSNRLDAALADHLDDVKKLFVAQGKATDKGIEYLSSGRSTQPGTYAVQITQAATRAKLVGDNEITGHLSTEQTLRLVDRATQHTLEVDLPAGSSLDEIVKRINSAASSDVAEVRRGTIANVDSEGAPITAATTFAQIQGAEVHSGDTIRIDGTSHTGDHVSSTFHVTDPNTDTVGDLLSQIRRTFSGAVSASVDAEGRIEVTDNQVGASELTVTLVEQNEGGGSLDFGSIDVEIEGRLGIEITASNDAGRLVLQHSGYGSKNGFALQEDLPELGLQAGEYAGSDVAGTINGEPAQGFGRILTGSSDNESTAGLSLRVTLDPASLTQSGTERGTVSLVFGVARLLSDSLASITDSLDGTLKHRTDAIDTTIRNLDDRIADTNRRVEQYRLNLVRKFSALEGAMATLQSQGNFLSSQLAGLSGTSTR